jgi:hypothetical protein
VTRRDVASKVSISNELCESLQGGTPRTLPDRGSAEAEFRGGFPTDSTSRRDGRLSSPAMERTGLMVGHGANWYRAGRLSHHRQDGEIRRLP